MYQNRYDRRMYRRMNRQQNPLSALAGGVFILFLFLAFLVSHGGFFLPLFFVGLALAIVLASLSAFHAWGIYGGMIGGSWLLGLALCVVLGFWPWILLPIALTIFLGALYRPIMGGLTRGALISQNQPPDLYQSQQPSAGTSQQYESQHISPPEEFPGPSQTPSAHSQL